MRGVVPDYGQRRRGLHYYSAAGRMTADTGAVAGQGIWCLWNPVSPPVPIYLISWSHVGISAASTFRPLFDRVTVRGTAGLTVTPDIDNDYEGYVAPASGAVLDLALYSAQPTTPGGQTAYIMRWQATAGVGETPMIFYAPKPILIPPGQGLGAIVQGAVACAQGDVTVEWCE